MLAAELLLHMYHSTRASDLLIMLSELQARGPLCFFIVAHLSSMRIAGKQCALHGDTLSRLGIQTNDSTSVESKAGRHVVLM